MTPAVALGRVVAMQRLARGWKRKDYARVVGISYPYLSEIETGVKEPSLAVLRQLAVPLGVPPSLLMRLAEDLLTLLGST